MVVVVALPKLVDAELCEVLTVDDTDPDAEVVAVLDAVNVALRDEERVAVPDAEEVALMVAVAEVLPIGLGVLLLLCVIVPVGELDVVDAPPDAVAVVLLVKLADCVGVNVPDAVAEAATPALVDTVGLDVLEVD